MGSQLLLTSQRNVKSIGCSVNGGGSSTPLLFSRLRALQAEHLPKILFKWVHGQNSKATLFWTVYCWKVEVKLRKQSVRGRGRRAERLLKCLQSHAATWALILCTAWQNPRTPLIVIEKQLHICQIWLKWHSYHQFFKSHFFMSMLLKTSCKMSRNRIVLFTWSSFSDFSWNIDSTHHVLALSEPLALLSRPKISRPLCYQVG